MVEHCVPKGVREMPIRAYLARAYPMLAGWALRDALKKRDVRVNGRKDAQCVRGGDVVRVYLPEESLFAQPLSILYEDGDILALEKPSGLPVDVDADGVGEDTVARRLERLRPGAHIAHRLDAGTGGVLLAGKTARWQWGAWKASGCWMGIWKKTPNARRLPFAMRRFPGRGAY